MFPKRYRYARFMSRNYLSLFFCYYGALVAEEWAIWIGMTAFGIILDLARKRWVPELSESPSALYRRMDLTKNNATSLPTLNFVKRPVASICWTTFIYCTGIIVIDENVGAEGMKSYYAFFEPFTTVMAQFSRVHEKLLIGLSNVGFPEQVPLTDHVYAFGLAGMAIWMVLVFCFVRLDDLHVGWSHTLLFGDCNKCKVFERRIVIGFFLCGPYFVLQELLSDLVECNKVSFVFDICDGPTMFFISIYAYFVAIFIMPSVIYFYFLLSMVLCGSSERQLKEYHLKGGTEGNGG